MSPTHPAPEGPRGRSPGVRLATLVMLGLGLAAHLWAAHLGGGSALHYGHHVFGFFLILAVTGGLIAGLGWLFWRSRPDLTLIAVGVVQVLFGVLVVVDMLSTAR